MPQRIRRAKFRYLSPNEGKSFLDRYTRLDEALTFEFAPLSHKRYSRPEIARPKPKTKADTAETPLPKMTVWADAVLGALFLADDYINRLTEEDAIREVRRDIAEALKAVTKKMPKRKNMPEAPNAKKESGYCKVALCLVDSIAEYTNGNVVPPQDLTDMVRRIQLPVAVGEAPLLEAPVRPKTSTVPDTGRAPSPDAQVA